MDQAEIDQIQHELENAANEIFPAGTLRYVYAGSSCCSTTTHR
jgi:hypothetical protein